MKLTKEYLKKLIKETLQKEGDYDNMTHGLGNMGAIAYEVVDDSGGEESKTFKNMQEVEAYLKKLDNMGADLYNIVIKPKFK